MGISVGLVGLGQFGSCFADLFMEHPLVDRIALCDRETERMTPFAEKESWRTKFNQRDMYDTFEAILKSDLDAVMLFTQPWLHAEQAVRAMEAGKHVYSAVPIVMLPDGNETLDWCQRIIETCERTGKRYMLGETTYYRPEAMFCRRMAAQGLFGDFVYAEGEYFHDVDKPECNLRDVVEARLASTSGREWQLRLDEYTRRGILTGPMHYPTHSTCGPVSVMGAHAVRVTAYGYRNRNNDPFGAADAFTNETALFKMSNGATARICEFRECGGPLDGKEGETFRIVGTKGTFSEAVWQCNHRETPPATPGERAALMARYERTVLDERDMRDPLPPEVVEAFVPVCPHVRLPDGEVVLLSAHGGSHPYLVHEFIDAVSHDRLTAVNAWEAARYIAMGVMAHESCLRDGERLAVPDFGNPPLG